jgi:phage baseplate assembly protein V
MQDFLDQIDKHFGRLYEEHSRIMMRAADIERRLDNSLRHGKVTDVDTKKQLFRMEVAQQDGQPVKSACIPYGQTAGDYKHHRPPTKGQQMSLFAPNGEIRQAVALPLTWSDDNKSPSDKPDEHVTTYGKKYRLKEKADERSFTLDKARQSFKDNTISSTINGGNTPGDDNGTKADDTPATDEQKASGSSIVQEEGKLTHKVKQTSQVMDENSITQSGQQTLNFVAQQSINLTVGGSTIVIEAGQITLTSAMIITDGLTLLGSPIAAVKVMLQSGPATKVQGI